MKVSRVSFALVSAAFLAAFATTCGASYAGSPEENAKLARDGYAILQQGDAKAAVEKFSAAINSDSLEPEVHINVLLNRALANQQLGEHGLAIADYSAALSMDVMAPALRSTALYNRGLSRHKTGDVNKAIEDFTASLLINPNFAEAYFSRATALRESGQLLFALSDYDRALRNKHPATAQVYFGSAMAYVALKRPVDAKKALNAALEINPDFGQARAQLILLGDENAQANQIAGSDPIVTGSVSPLAGGTLVTKPALPKAVAPPDDLMTGSTTAAPAKKIADRVPAADPDLEVSSTTAAEVPKEEVVAIEQVPEIPDPISGNSKASEEPESDLAAAPTEENIPTEDASADTAPVSGGTWSVQFASATSEDGAWASWKKMQSRFAVLKSLKPDVVRADLGTKGIYYRVRLGGFDTQDGAKSACGKLKAKGVSCYISKSES